MGSNRFGSPDRSPQPLAGPLPSASPVPLARIDCHRHDERQHESAKGASGNERGWRAEVASERRDFADVQVTLEQRDR